VIRLPLLMSVPAGKDDREAMAQAQPAPPAGAGPAMPAFGQSIAGMVALLGPDTTLAQIAALYQAGRLGALAPQH